MVHMCACGRHASRVVPVLDVHRHATPRYDVVLQWQRKAVILLACACGALPTLVRALQANMEGTLEEKRKEVVTTPTHVPASIDRPSSAIVRQDRADRSTSKSAMPWPPAAVTADGQGGTCHLAAGASATAVGAELPHATVQLPRNETAEEETASMSADTPLDLEVDDE
jgi:hypothetical protein